MIHPIWQTTCYCRGEIKTKELEEKAVLPPKSFKFISGKRPHEEESESVAGGKKGRVGRGRSAGPDQLKEKYKRLQELEAKVKAEKVAKEKQKAKQNKLREKYKQIQELEAKVKAEKVVKEKQKAKQNKLREKYKQIQELEVKVKAE